MKFLKFLFTILAVTMITHGFDIFAFGEDEKDHISVDHQIQIQADVTNSQDRIQPFAYLVQIQDEDRVTVSLAWLTGSLSPKQMLSPAVSWTPEKPGIYIASVFVWEAIDKPIALSHPLVLKIEVR